MARAMWRTDGTPAGTRTLMGVAGEAVGDAAWFTAFGGTVYLVGDAGEGPVLSRVVGR
jgi:ELWxxDGT repeat protein